MPKFTGSGGKKKGGSSEKQVKVQKQAQQELHSIKPFEERAKTAERRRQKSAILDKSSHAISKARVSCNKANELLHESVKARVEADRESPVKNHKEADFFEDGSLIESTQAAIKKSQETMKVVRNRLEMASKAQKSYQTIF